MNLCQGDIFNEALPPHRIDELCLLEQDGSMSGRAKLWSQADGQDPTQLPTLVARCYFARKQVVGRLMDGWIFLAGGGTAEQSLKIDMEFVAHCRHRRPLIYVPNALRSPPGQCLEWFRSVMEPLGVSDIEMWDHLRPTRPADAIGGVYIGGGDTVFLMDQLIHSGFDDYLKAVHTARLPIYGGSAGAIILGETLATSRTAIEAGRGEMPGLKLVSGHAVACHYEPDHDERLAQLSRDHRMTVIAIRESAGATFVEGQVRAVADWPVTLFHSDGSRSVA